MTQLSRRTVLRGGLAAFAAVLVPRYFSGCSAAVDDGGLGGATDGPQALRSLLSKIGPLQPANALGMRLPEGFTARVVAESGKETLAGKYSWHLLPDGGACFATDDGGWIYVSNCEMPVVGGAGALRFDKAGALVDAYPILQDTMVNCAGGPTPWGTWLSCEEISEGQVWECDPWGVKDAVLVPSLGRFKHEAVAVDPEAGHLYLSEDETDGCLYRYVAPGRDDAGRLFLEGGRLEVAVVDESNGVTWVEVPDPGFTKDVPTRQQIPEATAFDGGEGLWWREGVVFLSTKGDNKVWAYDTKAATIGTIYDRSAAQTPDALYGVDNLTVTACGDVLVAEDGGQMRIVAVQPDGSLVPLMQLEGQDKSEITGPAFDPSGTRLYFSSQRGQGLLSGITYEISGPFHEPMAKGDSC